KLKCHECNATDTTEWRTGPDGPHTLCNGCGLRYARQLKAEIKAVLDSSSQCPLDATAEKCTHCFTTTSPKSQSGPDEAFALCDTRGEKHAKKLREPRVPLHKIVPIQVTVCLRKLQSTDKIPSCHLPLFAIVKTSNLKVM